MPRQLSTKPEAMRSRQRRAEARAKVKAGKTQAVASTADDQAEAVETPILNIAEVEIQPPGPAPAQSFTQRMLARFNTSGQASGEEKKKTARKKRVEVNFLTKALPMVTGIAASYFQASVREPYKKCAPNQAEVTAVLAPIFSIIERRMQIHAELTEDEIDLMASGMAIIGYAGRAYVTYMDIKNKTVEASNAKPESRPDTPAAPTHDGVSHDPAAREAALVMQFGKNTPTDARLPADPVRQPPGHIDGFQASDDAQLSAGNPDSNGGADRSWELATVARAFKRDFDYRARQGLL